MKLDTIYSDQDVETLDVKKTIKFGFDDNAKQMIFKMFSKNIYSNPIGSVVREITSNCFDSHIEEGVNDPVILKLSKENSEYYISFIDVGVGMSPERVAKQYASAFSSTKRNDNTQIGGFGVGSMSLLAYTESYFLNTVHNGIEYSYSVRKGINQPEADLLSKKKTGKRNGTIIKLPIRSNDVPVFEREINRQLYYFENVIFEGFTASVKNDYSIIEGKNFFYRGEDYNKYVHICLGRVAYPIDWTVLEDGSDEFYQYNWDVPVALKLEIGEINVTVSREAIDYTEETKKLLKRKLIAVKEELLEMLKKQHDTINTIEDYYRMEDSSSRLFISKTATIDISSLASKFDISYKPLDAISIPSQTEVIHYFYDVSMYGKKGKRDHTWDKSFRTIDNEQVYLLNDDEQTIRKKNSYIKHHHKHFYTIKRKNFNDTILLNSIVDKLAINPTIPVDVVISQIRVLQHEIYNMVEGSIKLYSEVTVPDGFRVTSSKTYNPNYELPFTYISIGGRAYKEKLKISSLVNSKATIYYTSLDSENEMRWANHVYLKLFSPKPNKKFDTKFGENYPIKFVMVAKTNLKYISELPNFKPLVQFNKTLLRKRDTVISIIEKKFFVERFDSQNILFMNQNLFSVIDSEHSKTLRKIHELKAKYSKVRYSDVNTTDERLLNMLNIDQTKIKYQGDEYFKKIEEVTEKNGLLKYVRISEDFNPKDCRYSSYSEKEISDILQLLTLAYVK